MLSLARSGAQLPQFVFNRHNGTEGRDDHVACPAIKQGAGEQQTLDSRCHDATRSACNKICFS